MTFASLAAATEVKLTEVSTLAGLDSIQPFTVAFSDHPDGQPADPADQPDCVRQLGRHQAGAEVLSQPVS